jgi:hypothetical protein
MRIRLHRGTLGFGALALAFLLSAAPASLAAAGSLDRALAPYAASPEFSTLQTAARQAEAQGADVAQIEALLRGAHDGGVSAGVAARWSHRLASLASRDLPVSPVVSRYLQGVAKGIPAERIDGAIGELEARLQEAARRIDAACSKPPTEAAREARLLAIDHAAYALGLGIPAAQLEHSLVLARNEDHPLEAVQAPVLTLGILVASGIPAERSVQVLDTAWSRGYRGDDLERLGKAVGGLGREGKAPAADLIDRVVALIDRENSPDRVFQGLEDLMVLEGSRVSPIGTGEDPSIHRGDPPQVKEPPDTPAIGDQQRPLPSGD